VLINQEKSPETLTATLFPRFHQRNAPLRVYSPKCYPMGNISLPEARLQNFCKKSERFCWFVPYL
jgi:hypothetical protein